MARKERNIMAGDRYNNRTFVDNLRAIMNADRGNAKAANSRWTKDASRRVSNFQYATDDEVDEATNGRGLRPSLEEFIYTPISWTDKEGNQGSAYLISDPGRFGYKVFGMENFDGTSLTPNGTKRFFENILQNGGSVYYDVSSEYADRNSNPLEAHRYYNSLMNERAPKDAGTTSFSTGTGASGRRRGSDAMNFLRRYQEVGPRIFDPAYYKKEDL